MNHSFEREQSLFDAALLLPPTERSAFLARECGEDAQLRQRLEALLESHGDTSGILEQPALTQAQAKQFSQGSSREKPGDHIDRYKLLEQIGEGGCGVVYLAEQEAPVRRQVALKVIKLGMDTKQVVARFEAERQALAMMDHANIAKVFDAGATEAGRPFFVMELVRGVKITEYCDQENLSTRQRLLLFIQVCQAIQHAHQKGIIHRDIKPSNILVTLHNGQPTPKVIDFGIAKATTGQRLTDQTLFTALEQFLGTPAYMSPEQAQMSSLDIDTRSDIYSLGVLLYELLTGKTPFDAARLVSAALNELCHIIREEDPPNPSTRFITLDAAERALVAEHRQAEPSALAHLVRGDLDWVVMKCLEKDRTRRYETASSLGSDVQHYLNDEPVLAAAPRPMYKLLKFARRHRVGLAASLCILVALAATSVFSTWMYLRQRAALRVAVDEKKRADQQTDIVESLNDLFKDSLLGTSLPGLGSFKPPPGRTGGEFLGQLAARTGDQFKNRPILEARIRISIGDAYRSEKVKQPEMSLPQYEKALDLLRGESGPDASAIHDCMMLLMEAYGECGSITNLTALGEELLRLSDKKYGRESDDGLMDRKCLAATYERYGETQLAIALYEETMRIASKATSDTASLCNRICLASLAGLYEKQQQLEKAESAFREVIAVEKGRAEKGKAFGGPRAFAELGAFLLRRKRYAEAKDAFRQSLGLREGSTRETWMTFNLQSLMGASALGQKNFSEAESLLSKGYQGMKRLEDEIPIDRRNCLTQSIQSLAQLYLEWGKPDEADVWKSKLTETAPPAKR